MLALRPGASSLWTAVYRAFVKGFAQKVSSVCRRFLISREWEAGDDDYTSGWHHGIWLVSSFPLKTAQTCCCKGVQSGERGFGGDRSSYLLAGAI